MREDPETADFFAFPYNHATGRIERTTKSIAVTFAMASRASENGGTGRIDYSAAPAFSPLLRYPLAESLGGLPHRGLDVFYSKDDQDYQVLERWIAMQQEATEKPIPQSSKARELFAKTVLPVLLRNGCFLASCHGPHAFNDLKLLPPLSGSGSGIAGFSPAMIEANRKAAIGVVTRFIVLDGDAAESRLIRKALPLGKGGIIHKGGNEQFFESLADEDVRDVLRWIEAEKEETYGTTAATSFTQILRGIVYLRGPRHAPRPYFSFDTYYPGTELHFLAHEGGSYEAQSRRLATGLPCEGREEIQSFDIRYDARALVFAARCSGHEGFRLYHLLLDVNGKPTLSSQQLSFDATHDADGGLIHHVDPVYTPDYEDDGNLNGSRAAIAFMSNKAGHRQALWQDAANAPSTSPSAKAFALHFLPVAGQKHARAYAEQVRRLSYTGTQERAPSVRSSGEIFFTSLRAVDPEGEFPVYNGAIFRVHADGFDYHIHGGTRSKFPLYSHNRELPSGLEVRLALDPRNLWGAGVLMLADHGLGPAVEPNNPAHGIATADHLLRDLPVEDLRAVPRYVPPQFEIAHRGSDAKARIAHTGFSPGGGLRDPYPLADGSIIASVSASALDHVDPSADPDFNLAVLRFPRGYHTQDMRATSPVLEHIPAANTALSEYNPRPLMPRFREKHEPHQKFSRRARELGLNTIAGFKAAAQSTPGVLVCFDYPLLAALTRKMIPVGDPDPLITTPIAAVRVLSYETSQSQRLIIAEVPLEADGSFFLEIPSNIPLALQPLDADGAALSGINRWFYVRPGEKFTMSIPRSIYPLRCAGCHGSLTPTLADGLGPPDLASNASHVLANYNVVTKADRKPTISRTPRRVSLARDVWPVISRVCSACHASAADLRRAVEEWGKTRKIMNNQAFLARDLPIFRCLAEKQGAGERGSQRSCAPHRGVALSSNDSALISRWIETGAQR